MGVASSTPSEPPPSPVIAGRRVPKGPLVRSSPRLPSGFQDFGQALPPKPSSENRKPHAHFVITHSLSYQPLIRLPRASGGSGGTKLKPSFSRCPSASRGNISIASRLVGAYLCARATRWLARLSPLSACLRAIAVATSDARPEPLHSNRSCQDSQLGRQEFEHTHSIEVCRAAPHSQEKVSAMIDSTRMLIRMQMFESFLPAAY